MRTFGTPAVNLLELDGLNATGAGGYSLIAPRERASETEVEREARESGQREARDSSAILLPFLGFLLVHHLHQKGPLPSTHPTYARPS